jgi:hypothetical protein
MAPLGILTAIVSAIRVGGPSWLKAVIGCARENRAAVEVDLMSSTSHEVCELWNGKAVVRTLGRPMVQQLVFLGDCQEDRDMMTRNLYDEMTFGLFTLEEARRAKVLECTSMS